MHIVFRTAPLSLITESLSNKRNINCNIDFTPAVAGVDCVPDLRAEIIQNIELSLFLTDISNNTLKTKS